MKYRPNTRPRHKPRFEGEIIDNLYCPCGWCKERHSKVIATKIAIDGVEFLAWLYKSPCLKAVEQKALGSIKV